MTSDGRANPYPLYARLPALGPVAAIAEDRFVVCGYDAVTQALRDPGFGLPDAEPIRHDAEHSASDAPSRRPQSRHR